MKFAVRKEGQLKTPWDESYSGHTLIRNSPMDGDAPYVLEFGVNYFVSKLESLGLKTHWSCEGHPTNFYLVFDAPFEVATKIAYISYNYAEVAICQGIKKWVRGSNEIVYYKHPWWKLSLNPHDNSYETRNYLLRSLSIEWEKQL
jgi:hypothetical protein